MSETSQIGWTNHTSSPWFICTEVDPCCTNCYARELTERRFAKFLREAYRKAGYKNWETLPLWGKKAPRVMSRGYWTDIYKWDRKAKADGVRRRTFASLMDWLDDFPAGIIDLNGKKYEPAEVRARYLRTIFETPHLDHLLLTKRPELWKGMLFEASVWAGMQHSNDKEENLRWANTYRITQDWLYGKAPPQIWFGYTAGTKAEWKSRYEVAKKIPAKVRWISCEPLLNKDLSYWDLEPEDGMPNIHWIVIGGESGAHVRDPGVEALERMALEAPGHGIKVYFKQDAHRLPGQQRRISDEVWAMKEFPI